MLVSALIRGPARRLFRGKKYSKEVRPEVAALRTAPLKIEEYSTYTGQKNYNFEEQSKYTTKLAAATEQRNLIQELEQKTILPRRSRRIYDKPRYDLDISNYDCFRNIEDLFIKWSPHMHAVCCKIHAPPALVEKAFGKGLDSFRNGHYSTKEWDFTDSNFDQFLVYDYKATTEFWGPNKTPQEYEVALESPSTYASRRQGGTGPNRTLQQKSSGQMPRTTMSSESTATTTRSSGSSKGGSTRRSKKLEQTPRATTRR